MSESDFLTLIVNETFDLQKSGEDNLASLERKIQDYGLMYLRGIFIPQIQVLRFESPMGQLDIPVNWSFFSQAEHFLDSQNDPDKLFEILHLSWDQGIHEIYVTHADGYCYIVGLKEGDESHLNDLCKPEISLKVG
jgi:hypothetical protein